MGLLNTFKDLNQRVEFETEALSSIYNLSRVDLRRLPIEEQGRLTDEVLDYLKSENEILSKYNFTVMYCFSSNEQTRCKKSGLTSMW